MKHLLSFIAGLICMAVSAQTTDIASLILKVKQEYAPDSRTAVFDITATTNNDSIVLSGSCDNPYAVSQLIKAVSETGSGTVRNEIRLLPDRKLGDNQWGLITVGCAHLRNRPSHSAEMVSEAILGTPVYILEQDGSWFRIQTPDHYISWVHRASIVAMSRQALDRWTQSDRVVYRQSGGYIYTDKRGKEILSDITLGSIVETTGKRTGKYIAVKLPDGRNGYLRKSESTPFSAWIENGFDPEYLETIGRQMMGSTYLWGGTSTKGADCSGFVKTIYFAQGIILQRDASQQAKTGIRIAPQHWKECRKGDLLFFGSKNGRVNHVALYLQDGYYIHSSGRVKINSLQSGSELYLPTPFLSISRIDGAINTEGIIRVKDHPWYCFQWK